MANPNAAWSQAQIDFASRLNKDLPGLDFYTVLGWEAAEGGPADNPLNVRVGAHYGSPTAAADETAKFLTSEDKAGFYADIRAAIAKKYSSEDVEVTSEAKAIADNTHFNVITGSPAQIQAGRAQYFQNIDQRALVALYEGVQPNSKITAGGDIQNPPDNPGGLIGGIAGGIDSASSALGAIGNAFDWLTNGENWYRIGFFVLGIGLVGFGAYKALT